MNNNIIYSNSIKALFPLSSIQSLKINQLVTGSCRSDIGPFFRLDILARRNGVSKRLFRQPKAGKELHRQSWGRIPSSECFAGQGRSCASKFFGSLSGLKYTDSPVPKSGLKMPVTSEAFRVLRTNSRGVMAYAGTS